MLYSLHKEHVKEYCQIHANQLYLCWVWCRHWAVQETGMVSWRAMGTIAVLFPLSIYPIRTESHQAWPVSLPKAFTLNHTTGMWDLWWPRMALPLAGDGALWCLQSEHERQQTACPPVTPCIQSFFLLPWLYIFNCTEYLLARFFSPQVQKSSRTLSGQ